MPVLALARDISVVVQVVTSDSAPSCWEDRYSAAELRQRGGRQNTLTARH
jgi:hypothetical protein